MRRFLSTARPLCAQPTTGAAAKAPKPKTPKNPYSDSLILPKSDFPVRPSQDAEARKRLLEKSSTRVYEWQEENLPKEGTFVLHDGPPYANGDLHMGHALNKFLKDLVLRTHIQRGRRVSYIPGWDCHGLPIELKALQSLPYTSGPAPTSPVLEQIPGTPIRKVARGGDPKPSAVGRAKAMHPMEVRKLAGKLAEKTVEMQEGKFKEWGIMGDWGRKWRTMDKDYELRQLEIFAEMVEKELIYRRFKPVYWSPSSGSALAEAELEYNEKHESSSAFIRFPITKISEEISKAGIPDFDPNSLSALVWTTTPWTIPANRALAINASLEYGVIKIKNHGFLLVAVDRIPALMKELKVTFEGQETEPEVLAKFYGFQLTDMEYINPLLGEHAVPQPVLYGDFVTADSGTGIVHCAPGHGMEDYLLCQKHGIQAFSPVDDDGKFTTDVLPVEIPKEERIKVVENPDEIEEEPLISLAGKDVLRDGNAAVLRMLKQKGALVEIMKYKHKYPYDWRTKLPVIVRSTAQWFANVGGIKEAATSAIDKIEFIPDSGKGRLRNYVNDRNEWCISRQRAWGVPIPVLYDAETGEPYMTAENVRYITRLVFKNSDEGSDIWWNEEVPDEMFIQDEKLNGRKWIRGRETMDVWFDSGSSWATLMNRIKSKENPAADLYLEGSDQHRGWFQSSLLTAIAATGSEPYKSVLTHGFVLDGHGRKMSKSEGNIISPADILSGVYFEIGQNLKDRARPRSPDVLRLWVASTQYTKDVQIGKNILFSINEAYRKYRSTLRYIVSNLNDWDGKHTVPISERRVIDRYILHELRNLHSEILAATDSYAFYKAVTAFTAFTNATLSSFYFVILRDVLYAEDPKGIERRAALSTMFDILTIYLPTLTLLTPILAEEAYEFLSPQLKSALKDYAESINPSTTTTTKPDYSLAIHIPFRRSVPEEWEDHALAADFKTILSLDTQIKKLLEEAKKDSLLRVPMEASASLLPSHPSLTEKLKPYLPELASIFNVSQFSLVEEPETLVRGIGDWLFETKVRLGDLEESRVFVRKSRLEKCPRCWNFTREVEKDVCERCRRVLRQTGWRPGVAPEGL